MRREASEEMKVSESEMQSVLAHMDEFGHWKHSANAKMRCEVTCGMNRALEEKQFALDEMPIASQIHLRLYSHNLSEAEEKKTDNDNNNSDPVNTLTIGTRQKPRVVHHRKQSAYDPIERIIMILLEVSEFMNGKHFELLRGDLSSEKADQKEAVKWLKANKRGKIAEIMERFPIVKDIISLFECEYHSQLHFPLSLDQILSLRLYSTTQTSISAYIRKEIIMRGEGFSGQMANDCPLFMAGIQWGVYLLHYAELWNAKKRRDMRVYCGLANCVLPSEVANKSSFRMIIPTLMSTSPDRTVALIWANKFYADANTDKKAVVIQVMPSAQLRMLNANIQWLSAIGDEEEILCASLSVEGRMDVMTDSECRVDILCDSHKVTLLRMHGSNPYFVQPSYPSLLTDRWIVSVCDRIKREAVMQWNEWCLRVHSLNASDEWTQHDDTSNGIILDIINRNISGLNLPAKVNLVSTSQHEFDGCVRILFGYWISQ